MDARFSISEPPATDDELAIHALMKRYFNALRLRNADDLRFVFHETAGVESKSAGRMVSREEHIRAMRALLPAMHRVFFHQLLIRVETESKATVYGLTRYDTVAAGRWWQRAWKLTKTNGEWRIIRAYGHYA